MSTAKWAWAAPATVPVRSSSRQAESRECMGDSFGRGDADITQIWRALAPGRGFPGNRSAPAPKAGSACNFSEVGEGRPQSPELQAQGSELQPQGSGLCVQGSELHPQGSGLCAQGQKLQPPGSKLQLRSSATPTPELFALRLELRALQLEFRASTAEAPSRALGAHQLRAQGFLLCA